MLERQSLAVGQFRTPRSENKNMNVHTLPAGKYILRWKKDEELYRKNTIEIIYTKEVSEARQFTAEYLNTGGAWNWSVDYDAVPVGKTEAVPDKAVEVEPQLDESWNRIGSAAYEKAKPVKAKARKDK